MKLTYEIILKVLSSNYTFVEGKEKNYFLDDSNRIVATIDENLITMFYDFPALSREIFNHFGKVAVAFAKDFNVNGQICDVLCIGGLFGGNDFIMNKDFFIGTKYNVEMKHLLDSNENLLQKQFEALNYEEKISVLEESTGANIDGIQLFREVNESELGNCGHLSATNGIASFDICGVIQATNIVVKKVYKVYDINIINFKNIHQKPNYEEVYNFYRQKNDWHYNTGYKTAGSKETRDFTERRRYSTVDIDSIHIREPIMLKSVLDSIYENGNQSLNAKKLQMIYILNSLLKNRESEDYVSSHYNFNVRNCDLRKQKVKR